MNAIINGTADRTTKSCLKRLVEEAGQQQQIMTLISVSLVSSDF